MRITKPALLTVLSATLVAIGCSNTAADTATPEAATPAVSTDTTAQEPTVDPQQLAANDQELEALTTLSTDVEAKVASATEAIEASQKAWDELAALAKEHEVSEKKVARMVSKTMAKGKAYTRGAPKAAREDFSAKLEALAASVEGLQNSAAAVASAQSELAQLEGRATELEQSIRDRSATLTVDAAGTLHPDAQADLDQVGTASADLKAKVDGARTQLEEATTKAQTLAQSLGVELKAAAAPEEAAAADEAAPEEPKAEDAKKPEPAKAAPAKAEPAPESEEAPAEKAPAAHS